MDQGALVVDQFNVADQFLGELDRVAPVVVAFWLKESEDEPWDLYVAPKQLNESNFNFVLAEIVRIAALMNDPNFDPFRVKLVTLTDQRVRAALAVCKRYPGKTPIHMHDQLFGGIRVQEVNIVWSPKGEYTMPTGREVLNQITDQEAAFFEAHGKPPAKMLLPVLMAYDLAKCGREDLGDLSGRVFKDGIKVFEKEGFHGMKVEIVRDRNATLQFE